MPGFEGTFLGDSSKLHPDTRLECKVCHYIYDPSKGDVDQNIEPGTPFSELPEYWNCPAAEPSVIVMRFGMTKTVTAGIPAFGFLWSIWVSIRLSSQ